MELIDLNISNVLLAPVWPCDFGLLQLFLFRERTMHPIRVLREVAAPAINDPQITFLVGLKQHLGTDAIAIGFRSDQFQATPISFSGRLILQECCRLIHVGKP